MVKWTEQAVCVTEGPRDLYLFARKIQEFEHAKDCKKRNGGVLVKTAEFPSDKVDWSICCWISYGVQIVADLDIHLALTTKTAKPEELQSALCSRMPIRWALKELSPASDQIPQMTEKSR